MGGQWSSPIVDNERESSPDPFWPQSKATTSADKEESSVTEKAEDGPVRLKENQKKLEEFKKELAGKREVRHKAIVGLSNKLKHLQLQVATETEAKCVAEAEVERLKALLEERGEVSVEEMKKKMEELEKEKEESEHQVYSLRRVASIGKEMLRIRELQVNELKKKLMETASYPSGLREEYEAQIQNVRRLKMLYEERAEAARLEHQRELQSELTRVRALEAKVKELEKEKKSSESTKDQLKCHITKLDEALGEESDQSMTLREKLDASLLECRDLSSQMALVNNLFSKVLLGNIDVDRLTRLLQENQSLMTELTSNDGARNDLAALLLKIVEQIDSPESESTESNAGSDVMTEEQVSVNLSKVWQILVQLLADKDHSPSDCDSDSCYKSVETPSGTKSVISVSQTFITLKTLILEKNALINEVGKLKSLNDHLETRLGSQEKRLAIVSTELKKTWGVVSKLRSQHKQLHTQEKILRYELQHKRQLLNELKEELERCRDKWTMARKKNTQSEEDWRNLRKEFAERKNRQVSTSAESGYEDEELRSPPTEDESCPAESNDGDVTENEEIDLSEHDLRTEEEILSRTSFYMSNDNHSSSSIQSSDTVIRVDLNDLRFTDESKPTVNGVDGLDELNHDNVEECERIEEESESNESQDVIADNSSMVEKTEIPSDSDISPSHQTGKSFVNKNKTSSTSCSAENISKFLEGLFAPDDEVSTNSDLQNISVQCSAGSGTQTPRSSDESSVNLFRESTSTIIPERVSSPVCETESCLKNVSCENSPSLVNSEENASSLPPVTEKPSEETPLPSSSSTNEDHKRTAEEVLDARTARLKRLEEQCKQLFNKVTATTHKSNALSTKLDQIHEQYGGGNSKKLDEAEATTEETTIEDQTTEERIREQGEQDGRKD